MMTLCTRCKKRPKTHPLSPYCRICRTEADLENKERWIAKAKEKAKRQNEDLLSYERRYRVRLRWWEKPLYTAKEKFENEKPIETSFQVVR